MSITQETRREAYEAIQGKTLNRKQLILMVLGQQELTVDEIVNKLIAIGKLKEFDRNFVAPRLTELKQEGVLEAVRKCKSGRTARVVTVWRRKKSRPGAGTPETATKKNNLDTVYTGEEEIVK